MPSQFDLVTIDAPDTEALAAFYSAALDLHEVENEDDSRWIVLASADSVRRIGIQRGATVVGSVHLDIACPPIEFDAELARLIEIGSTLISEARHEPYGSIANLADPDGNLFDLCGYH
ncbi:MAG: VOC family protein [Ilumatobacter sp.]